MLQHMAIVVHIWCLSVGLRCLTPSSPADACSEVEDWDETAASAQICRQDSTCMNVIYNSHVVAVGRLETSDSVRLAMATDGPVLDI